MTVNDELFFVKNDLNTFRTVNYIYQPSLLCSDLVQVKRQVNDIIFHKLKSAQRCFCRDYNNYYYYSRCLLLLLLLLLFYCYSIDIMVISLQYDYLTKNYKLN